MARSRGVHVAALSVLVLLAVAVTGCKMNRYKSTWRTDVNAPLNARFVVAGDSAVILRFGPTRAEGRLAGYSLASGDERWQQPAPEFILESAMGAPLAAADAEQQVVYLVQDSTVAAHSVSDGARRWIADVKHLTSTFEDFTNVQAPAGAGGRVLLLSRHSRIVALDRQDGKLLWRTDGGGSNRASVLAVVGGVVLTLSNEEKDVRGHDLATGKQLWVRPMSDPFEETERLSASIALAARRPQDGLDLFHVVDGKRALLALDARAAR